MNAMNERHGTGMSWTAALVLLLGAAAAAQSGMEPTRVRKPAATVVEPWHEPDLVAVKFRDGLRIRLAADALTDGGTGVLSDAAAVLAGPARGRWERTHHVDEATLERFAADARARSGRTVPDLNLEYRLKLAGGLDAAGAIDALNALEIVEFAWPVGRPTPPPLPPDFTAQQGYQAPATSGTGSRDAWPLPAGTGAGVRICDIEYEYNAAHVDLPPVTILGPPWIASGFGTDHATAVLGQLFARSNGFGVTGGAYGAQPFFAAAYTASGWNVAAAITNAMTVLGPGDVILLEQQAIGPAGPTAYVPVEWDFAVYNAIRNAVAAGVIVVEAAANGSQNLDSPIYNTGHAPFLPGNDSGAILVGAGASPGGSTTDRSRLSFSNYGATVDLQGWGENVTTTGYGALYSAGGANELYTATFGGTSSASPIVAAACAQLSAMYRVVTGDTLDPLMVRDTLRATGSAQQSGIHPASQSIGPRPNLAAALASLGSVRGCADDDSWSPGFTGPSGRREAAIAYDSARGRVIVFGGETSTLTMLGDTLAWVAGGPAGNWIGLSPATSPSPRAYAAMAYDRKRDRMVLYGGWTSSGVVGETWEFNGSTWSLVSTTGPGPMILHALAYDAARERVVLVARGCSGAGCPNATWEWNGTSWTSFAGGPSGRDRAGLAYDSDRQRLVLFGGSQIGPVDLGETWERSGTTWTLVASGGPSPRSGSRLVYDTGRRRCVLFGGHTSSPFVKLGDVWGWNGSSWRQELPLVAPDPRTYHALAYHEGLDREVIVGGDTQTQIASSVYYFRERADQPGIPFCFGDGSGVACPCGNSSAAGACVGCLNSLGVGGRLRSIGQARLSNDTVVLVGTDQPNSSALYFQGMVQQSGGAGLAFGDGLRCAGGSVVRLGTQVNSGGGSSYPLPGQMSVSQRGMVLVPGVRTYQVWFRNAAAYCTSATFNTTNGLQIVWGL